LKGGPNFCGDSHSEYLLSAAGLSLETLNLTYFLDSVRLNCYLGKLHPLTFPVMDGVYTIVHVAVEHVRTGYTEFSRDN